MAGVTAAGHRVITAEHPPSLMGACLVQANSPLLQFLTLQDLSQLAPVSRRTAESVSRYMKRETKALYATLPSIGSFRRDVLGERTSIAMYSRFLSIYNRRRRKRDRQASFSKAYNFAYFIPSDRPPLF